VLGACKLAEDADDLVLRAIETSGRGASTRIDLPAWQRNVQFEIAPYEIRTFQVPRDPRLPVTETDLLERPLGADERLEAATRAQGDAAR
jgi:alpha-mannosidase